MGFFRLPKIRGGKDKRKFPRKRRSEKSWITIYNIVILYTILCFPGGKCPQNRYLTHQYPESITITDLSQCNGDVEKHDQITDNDGHHIRAAFTL